MAGDYQDFLDRLQNQFSPSQMTYSNLINQMGAPTAGRRSLAEQFSQSSIIAGEIEKATDYEELKWIQSEISWLEAKKHAIILQRQAQTKLDRLGKELAEITEQRRAERLEEEEIERKEQRIAKKIAELSEEAEYYENIRDTTDDRRKRNNAKRNIDKINDRIRNLTD